ncbi:MAG: helix-turn-helix transcriptional regulator [Dongiaceae bacterium]
MRTADRVETVRILRERLTEVIVRSGLSRSGFAERLGIDRSTLSQVLAGSDDRLPRAETLATIARDRKVSVDWLLGLTQQGGVGTDLLTQPLEMEPGGSSPADARLTRWHNEAAGYKIRYIPSTLPDLFKTEAVIRYEYRTLTEPVSASRIEAATARLEVQRRPESDMEVCSTIQAIEGFARGEGYWSDLPVVQRREQLHHMIALMDELYPTFRWFLYDARDRYSVPITVFGPLRATIYIGQMYMVFNSTEHIRALTAHFDELIRAAKVQPPDVPPFLRRLLDELDGTEAERG